MNYHEFKLTVGGREVTIETGKYAEQANGSCVVRCGETAVMVTVCMSATPREGIDFFPLQVDYEEKMYAVGKIPGGFKRREGRASDKAILTARLIDRPLRPLFPKGLFNDVVVVASALSVEPDIAPEPLAMIGSSVALSISDIPWAGPTGSVVVGLVDGEYVINPDAAQREKSTIHLNLAGTKDAILMIEAGADEVTNDEMVGAIMFGHNEIKKICAFIEDVIVPAVGKAKLHIELYHIPEELDAAVRAFASDKVDWAIDTFDRKEREARQAEARRRRSSTLQTSIPTTRARSRTASTTSPRRRCAPRSSIRASAPTAEASKTSVPSGANATSCPACTAPPCSREVRRRRSRPAPLRCSRRRRSSKASTTRRASAICTSTTSPATARAKPRRSAAPAAARSATARLQSARSSPSSLRRGVPLRHPCRQRHPLLQRLFLDGVRLRLHDGAHGCGRSHQGSRRGRCDGPHQEPGRRANSAS